MIQVLGYKTTSRVPIGFYFCIFILFLNSMGLWIGWADREKIVNLVTIIALVLYLYNYYYVKFVFSKNNVFLAFILFIGNILFIQNFGLTHIQGFFIFLIICCLRHDYQIQCLYYIVKWFAWLMIVSILVFLLAQLGAMPSFGTLNRIGDVMHSYFSQDYIVRTNYLFYCASDFYGIRFNGPFTEPGHLGMMSAFLLYADGFDFRKKETWIILFAILLTFSLAGYVLVFVSFLFLKYEKNEIKAHFILLFLIFILVVYLFGIFYNNGDNFLNEMIFSRLEYDEEKGFSGNNRVFGQIDIYYAAMFNDIHTLLFGYDKETIEYLAWHNSRGSGFVMSMVTRGIVGSLGGLMFYFVYYFYEHKNKTTFLFLSFVLLMFWQRSYPLWFSWIICFVFGISNRRIIL